MYYNKFFLKYGLKYNDWVGHSVMKPADTMASQKIKRTREGKNDESDNFEMEIIDEGALDKVLTVLKKTLDVKIPVRQFMRSSTMDISKNQALNLRNIFIEIQNRVQCL